MTANLHDLSTIMGQRLKEARQRKNLSQAELGALIGRDPSTVSNYENGVRSIGNVDLINLAEVLEIPVAFLFGEEFAARDAELGMYEWLRANRGDILELYTRVYGTESPVPSLNRLAQLISQASEQFFILSPRPGVRRRVSRPTYKQEDEPTKELEAYIQKIVDEHIEKRMAKFMSTVEEESHSHPSD